MPQGWIDSPNRLQAAGIPDQAGFVTKPALAQAMLTRALNAAVPAAWVTGDEVYGADPRLWAELEARGVGYVLAVACGHPTSSPGPELPLPPASRPATMRISPPAGVLADSDPTELAKERPDGLRELVWVVVVGHVGTGRVRDLDPRALGKPPGRLPVDGVRLLAYQHHHRDSKGRQRLIIGQEPLIAPQLDPEEGLGRCPHALPKCGLEPFPVASPATQQKSRSSATGGPPASMPSRTTAVTAPRAPGSSNSRTSARLVQDRAADDLGIADQQAQVKVAPALLP